LVMSSERKRKSDDSECCDAAEKKSKVEVSIRPKTNDIHKKHEPYPTPKIVSKDEWIRARRALNEEEKQFTRLRDELTQKRHHLPWTQVDNYEFDHVDAEGKASKVRLSDAFAGRSDLVVWHFMFPGPDGKNPCPSCSAWCDGFNGYLPHINAKATFVAIAKAAAPDLAALTKRKGWNFPMLSAEHNAFNKDFATEPTEEEKAGAAVGKAAAYSFGAGSQYAVSQLPGLSVFHIDKDKNIFRTYTAMSRGLENFNAYFALFDCLPQGRDGFNPKHKEAY